MLRTAFTAAVCTALARGASAQLAAPKAETDGKIHFDGEVVSSLYGTQRDISLTTSRSGKKGHALHFLSRRLICVFTAVAPAQCLRRVPNRRHSPCTRALNLLCLCLNSLPSRHRIQSSRCQEPSFLQLVSERVWIRTMLMFTQ